MTITLSGGSRLSNGIDARNLKGACADLARHVERNALAALYRHGYSGLDAGADAPNTWEELRHEYYGRTWAEVRKGRGKFAVFNGASDTSIYASALTNILFRAWHDLTHIECNAGFDFESECRVARKQAQGIPDGLLREIFLADTVGQSEFADATYGGFVTDQRTFVRDYLNHGGPVAIAHHRHLDRIAA